MASLAEINVRIGARIDQLQKNLRTAERSLRQSGERMKQLGDSLTVGITAPLTALGGFALKAQADFDALRKGIEAAMTNAGGSIEDARTEIELLRKESLKPGLTFDNLLKGSIKLQAVGFSAEEARRSLTVFGNALALAGGNANDLDGVNLALTQIVSKGQVFAEEINQIAERVPQVRKAMLSAFGTARTEEIQKLNLAAEDFVRIITDELAKLPDAPESLANSFKNARQAITFALQDIGGALEENLNVSGFVQELAQRIINVSKAFANLNPVAQKFVIISAGILAAIGPILSTTGRLIKFTGQLQAAYLATSVSINKLKFRVLESVKAFQALSVAQKATIAGLGLAALGLAIGIYANLAEKSEEAARAQRNVREATKEAAAEIGREEYATKQLFNVLKDANASTNERQRALDELKAKYPSYLGNLDAEKLKLGDIEIAQKKVNEELTKSIAARIQNQKQEEIAARIAEKRLRITELQSGAEVEVSEARRVNTGELVKFGSISNAVINELQQDIKILGDESNLLSETFNKTFGTDNPITTNRSRGIGAGIKEEVVKPTIAATDATRTFEQELQKLQETLATLPKRSEEYYDTLKKIADLQERIAFIDRPAENVPQQVQTGTGIVQPVTFQASQTAGDDLTKSINDIWSNIQSNIDVPKFDTTPFQNYNKELERANELYQAFGDKTAFLNDQIAITEKAIVQAIENGWSPQSEVVQELIEKFEDLNTENQKFAKNLQLAYDAGVAFATSLVKSAKQGESALKSLGKAVVAAAKTIINALLAEAIAYVVKKAFQDYGIAGALIAAAGGGIVTGVFNAAIPELANGGVVDSPTLALVGEYPGAKSNPEIIAPEDKLTKIFKENQSDGMGRVAVEDIVIEGDKLRIVLDEANRRYSRYGG